MAEVLERPNVPPPGGGGPQQSTPIYPSYGGNPYAAPVGSFGPPINNYGGYGGRKVLAAQLPAAQQTGLQFQSPYGPSRGLTPQPRPAASPAPGAGSNPFTDTGKFNAAYGVNSVIGNAYNNGVYGNGSPAWLDDYYKFLQAQGQGNVNRAELGAQTYAADDPLAALYARITGENSANNTTAQAMAAARAHEGEAQDAWLRQLFSQYVVPSATGSVPSTAPHPGTNWAQLLGQLGGAGIGAFFGGPAGAGVGSQIGGSLGGAYEGSNNPSNNDFNGPQVPAGNPYQQLPPDYYGHSYYP